MCLHCPNCYGFIINSIEIMLNRNPIEITAKKVAD